jgi:CBS domain-containing protein
MRLQEIMTESPRTIPRNATVGDARNAMRTARVHHLVVAGRNGARVDGVVSERDVRNVPDRIPLGDVMSADVVTAKPETTVKQAANLLRGHVIGCLPVVDRNRVVGIVTISDLLALVGRGAERPVAKSVRWTLRRRAPRPNRAPAAGRR